MACCVVCPAQYLHQEVEHLRESLQQHMKQVSSLDAEVRLLKEQLVEAKAEARQDKQGAERKLQDQQMEAARQRTLAEQALVRQQRAQEEATLAQQDLSTAKQHLQKAEMERDAAQQQVQALQGELRKLRTQHTTADQEVRQLQLQVQQQQQQDRRLQEQLQRERQLQQEEVTATRASIEQHRNELRRWARCVCVSLAVLCAPAVTAHPSAAEECRLSSRYKILVSAVHSRRVFIPCHPARTCRIW